MSDELVLSIRQDVSLSEVGTDRVTLQAPQTLLTFKQVTAALRSALRTLLTDGAAAAELNEMLLASDGVMGLYKLQYFLGKLADACLLCHTAVADGARLATIVPLSGRYTYRDDAVSPSTRWVLSRFACCRKEGSEFTVESPLGFARVVLRDRRARALFMELAEARSGAELASSMGDMSDEQTSLCLKFLRDAGALSEVGPGLVPVEAERPELVQWEFHDLLFHSRSRLGRHNNPYGGALRFVDEIPPLPPLKPPMSSDFLELTRPDLAQIERGDTPFVSVIENRRSAREQGDEPINSEQLAEFLYRSARVKEVNQTELGEVTRRPYPGAGAIYELEIYTVVDRCEGVSAGLYHYDPLEHRLAKLSDQNGRLDGLLEAARNSYKGKTKTQILVVLAARFQRSQWKYASMSYAAILKDVGVLLQTMNLTATAMGLGSCVLGGGDSDLFCEAANLDYYAETSVGELILGNPPGR